MRSQAPFRRPEQAASFEQAPRFATGKLASNFDFGQLASRYGIFFAIIGLGVFLSFADKYFLTVRNLTNLLVQISPNGLLATGMTFVIIGRHRPSCWIDARVRRDGVRELRAREQNPIILYRPDNRRI